MNKSKLLLNLALFLGAISLAQASEHRRGHHGEHHRNNHHRQCTTTEQSTWLPLADIMLKAETDGYRLRKATVKRSCYEVDLRKGTSRLKKIYDPSNGNLVETKESSHHE